MRRSKFKSEEFLPRPVVPCAHEGCPNPAIIAKKLKTGWANLCKKHDLFHVQQEADEFCRRSGLTTRGIISLTPALISKAFPIVHNILDSHSVLA